MVTYSGSVPAAIIKSSSSPSASDYYIWIDSSTNDVYWSDGSTWTKLNVSLGDLNTPILENALAILEIQAADTITPDTKASIIDDIYSDSNGYNNTLDAATTTAFFNSTKYQNSGNGTSENLNITMGSNSSQTRKSGVQITNSSTYGRRLTTIHTNSTATTAYLYSDNGANDIDTLLDTQTITAGVATFNYDMDPSTKYWIIADDGGSAYTESYDTAMPTGTYASVTYGYSGGPNASNTYNITQVTTDATPASNVIIQTAEQTLSSSPTNFQIFAYKQATAGTGSITADISFDSGAHYQTGVSLNTAYTITNTGTGMILKINLNAGASSGTAESEGYAVLVW